ncbi:APC family permease [Planctomicrobium sp. SH527]|uniref:APC family permease n=1 Tax=Planctomicrobium sp. SH527 TaxID=3448123 RepID=UPI003F5BC5FC
MASHSSESSGRSQQTEVSSPRTLGLWDVVSLLVGIVVGVSIFRIPANVFTFAGDPQVALMIWGLGALLALCGAFCYAELSSMWPEFGAEYVYLANCFGKRVGFLFAWMNLCAILPSNIGAAAFVFASYAGQLHPVLASSHGVVAMSAIMGLTLLQFCGFAAGRMTQNILTITKALALAAVLICGLILPAATVSESATTIEATTTASWSSLGLALVFVLYAYGGWNDVATVTPEVRDCRRTMSRALIIGLVLVALLYLALNFLFLRVLGPDEVKNVSAPAAVLIERACGPMFSNVMSVVVMISALGAINGMMFAGCRLLAAAGEDFPIFRKWSVWNSRQVPVWSLLTISAIALTLTAIVGFQACRERINEGLKLLRLPALNWDFYGGGFDLLLAASAPVFWVFFLLAIVALIVARWKYPNLSRPFRVPFYPIPAILFGVASIFMLWSSLGYSGGIVLLMAPALFFGILVAVLQTRFSQIESDLES